MKKFETKKIWVVLGIGISFLTGCNLASSGITPAIVSPASAIPTPIAPSSTPSPTTEPWQVTLQAGRQGIDHGKHEQSGQQNRQEMQVQNGQQGECGEHMADLAESCGIESCGKRHRTGGFLSVAQSVSRRGAMPVRAVISVQ